MILPGDLHTVLVKQLEFVGNLMNMKNYFKNPNTYILLIFLVLSIQAWQLKHYDVLVIWLGWLGYSIYDLVKEKFN